MKSLFMLLFFSVCLNAQIQTIVDENTNRPMAVGIGDRSVFEDSSFSAWFDKEYSFYKIREELEEISSDDLDNVEITVVMGTWCHDSRREVPRFYKIMDYLSFPEDKIKLIFVDRKKQGLENEVEGLDIDYVPTFIFYRNEEELGRIIESPDETLEEDFQSIIK